MKNRNRDEQEVDIVWKKNKTLSTIMNWLHKATAVCCSLLEDSEEIQPRVKRGPQQHNRQPVGPAGHTASHSDGPTASVITKSFSVWWTDTAELTVKH